MKSNSVSKRPLEIKNGNVTVKIYTVKNRVNGASYPQFTLVHYLGSQRIKRKFADLKEARREAELVAAKLASGENEVLRLTSTDRVVYLQARAELHPLNLPLNVAVSEYVNTVKRLPQGVKLSEAVDFFLRRNPTALPQKTVREVVDELIASKTKQDRGEKHLADLESRLGRFADAMQMNIGQVTGVMIQKHLDELNVAGRTQQNHLRHITSLFRFAARKKYLPKDALDEIAAVEKPEAELTDIEIFSPVELRELLTAARPEIIPWLAVAAFAGLRTAELQRLDWHEVNLTERYIEVTAAKSKTASRRLVPITDNSIGMAHASRTNRRALLQVQHGTLVSYGGLAATVNQPAAARAVGSAVGQNSLAYLIPCHRVIRETTKAKHRMQHQRKNFAQRSARFWRAAKTLFC